MKDRISKTNAMRILDSAKVKYVVHEYPHEDTAVPGDEVARLVGADPDRVFKTLVTRGSSGEIFVFIVPVREELDLKKAAKYSGEKAISMVRVSELLNLTGYIRGGCTAIGMKKDYPVFLEETASLFESIFVSGGKIGLQIELDPEDLLRTVSGRYADLITD